MRLLSLGFIAASVSGFDRFATRSKGKEMFLANPSEQSYDQVVNYLLGSDSYSEHWAYAARSR